MLYYIISYYNFITLIFITFAKIVPSKMFDRILSKSLLFHFTALQRLCSILFYTRLNLENSTIWQESFKTTLSKQSNHLLILNLKA